MRGRPSRLTSSTHGTLVSSATYTPLDQPLSRTTGNGVVQSWSYPNPDARLMQLTIGSGFNRSYSYDSAGNVTGITDLLNAANTQSYGYDARDRLTSWTLGGTTATYAYNNIGNLTNKAGTAYTYPAAGTPRPHAPTSVGGQAYSYDANGNLLSGGGRTYVWTADNRPVSITTSSGTESYRYDADGNRTRRSGGGVTRIYLEGSKWEEQTGGGTIRTSYLFNGQVVAQRDSTGGAPVVYLHGDHLGSVGLTSSTGGTLSAVQEFDPWGTVRSGASSATLRNYTGQYLDGTGLLFYNARYYDPVLARFISADSIVPGAGALTLAPLDSVATSAWSAGGGGPANPQDLNRYSYGLNNPLRYTDPTGHCSGEQTVYNPKCTGQTYFRTYAPLDEGTPSPAAGGAQTGAPRAPTTNASTQTTGNSPGAVNSSNAAPRVRVNPNAQPEDVLVRQGKDWESASRLGRQAQDAENAGFPHGVSVTTPASNARLSKDPSDASNATRAQFEEAGFPVQYTPTGRDPNHHTVQLPKPVTPDVARQFNQVLGRVRRNLR